MFYFNKLLKFHTKFVTNYSTYSISEIFKTKPIENNVSVKGWIKSLRNMKDKFFVDLSDGSCNSNLQIVIPKNLITDYNLNTGASIHARGVLDKTPKGQLEIKANKVEVFGDCVVTDGYPFAPRKVYHPDYIRQYLHFRPCTNKFSAVLRTRNAASLAIHNYLNSEGFVSINTPILTSNDCEGAGEIFSVCPDNNELIESMRKSDDSHKNDVFFSKKVFLSVSGQMHLEAAAHGLSKVYTLGPTFRAENSKSRLHLSEFYMFEVEIAFINNLETLCRSVEKLIKSVTKNVLNTHSADVNSILQTEENIQNRFSWLEKEFLFMNYDDVSKILKDNIHKFKTGFDEKLGLSKEHELFLVEYNGNVPTFVVNWPANLKPFYMKSIDNEKVAAFDLLVSNVGELVGGSLRENDYNILKSKIPIQSDQTQMEWYLDLRKFGGVPTGGYGMGFERYLQFILNIQNIKDTIPFPRWPHNCAM